MITLDEIKEELRKSWDPIGMNHIPDYPDYPDDAPGEYDGYAEDIYNILSSGSREDDLFKHLWAIETERMGLQGDEENTRNSLRSLHKKFNRNDNA